MTRDTLTAIREARAVSTPLIAIATADPYAAAFALVSEYDREKNPKQKTDIPIIGWDCVRGYFALNDTGGAALGAMVPAEDEMGLPGARPDRNPVEALAMACDKAPAGAFLVFWNADTLMGEPQAIQGFTNCRDPFKANKRTAVLLAPSWKLPPAMAQDTLVLDDPLPTAADLAELIETEHKNFRESKAAPVDLAPLTAEDIEAGAAALVGLSRFPAEQSIAMSLRNRAGALDRALLWQRKNAYIRQIPGLIVEPLRESLDDVRGLDAITDFERGVFEGKERPAVVVRLEELEKQLAGAKGDNTGVSQDALSSILTAMEDHEWTGLIGFGVPGSGKSYLPRCIAKSYDVPCLSLDLGAAKDPKVGMSEAMIRTALKTIYAIGGSRVYFMASCNGVANIPAALRRRFTDGIWYFDLMPAETLTPLWTYYRQKYGLDFADELPNYEGWTPAEIRNCCRTAYRQNRTLKDAARFIVPVSKADRQGLADMQKLAASNGFLDANKGGEYRDGATAAKTTRGRMYDDGEGN